MNTDCYSAGEREAMLWTQRLRGWILGPLLKWLTWCGVHPDHITLASFLCGLAFCVFPWQPVAACVALGLHILLDGVDGPLARYQELASSRGSFTDTLTDQIVVATSTLTLMSASVVEPVAGGGYIFLYTVVVALAMIRNVMEIPYRWLVRPRFPVYAWILVELYLWPGTMVYLLWGFNALLGVNLATGFFMVRRKL